MVATLGIAILVICGGTDLSAGYSISFGGSLAAACLGWWHLLVAVAVIAGISACVLLSLVNGILSIKLKINSLMFTLGTMTVYSGISNTFTGQKAIFNLPDGYKMIGQGSLFGVIPIPALIMVLAVAAISFLLKKMCFGRYTFAVGGNAQAARLEGIHVTRTKRIVYAIGGALFGISATMLTARNGFCERDNRRGHRV